MLMWNRRKNSSPGLRGRGLDPRTEAELGYRARVLLDVTARDALVESHLGLVRRMAVTFARRGGSFDDLIQEGSLALMRAAETFEPERQVRFATYAAYWVRSHMQRHMGWQRSHQYAAPASVAYSGGLNRDHSYQRTLVRTLSLDAPVSAGSDQTLGQNLPGEECSPETLVAQVQARSQVRAALLRSLGELGDERAAVVIQQRLLSEKPATLNQLGDALDLSREGARLLEARLLKRVKAVFNQAEASAQRRRRSA